MAPAKTKMKESGNDGFTPFAKDFFGQPVTKHGLSPLLRQFTLPPFSTFDTRKGAWQERKRAWLNIGIESEVGRGENLLRYSKTVSLKKKKTLEDIRRQEGQYNAGRKTAQVFNTEGNIGGELSNTSIFDPVLCELCYRWWSPEGGQIIDPFAGGSVRGIVANYLNRKYWGCELRIEQVEANRDQAGKLCKEGEPEYVCGDSRKEMKKAPKADFVFTCPPYGDLEKYSEEDGDLSDMTWDDFLDAYEAIIEDSVDKLKQDRFAAIVVGDFRDKKTGLLRNFVGETTNMFLDAGMDLYNHAILVTAVGSAPKRAASVFGTGRKLVKTHQDILVFSKGDALKAAEVCKGEQK